MKFKGLNGRTYTVYVRDYKVVKARDGRGKRSSYHKRARGLLGRMYKGYTVLEEMKIQGAHTSTLFLDFFIPTLSIAVEVHGEQHYKFIPHFHRNRVGYRDSLKRDRLKREWCELNELDLVTLKFSDDTKHWRKQLEER